MGVTPGLRRDRGMTAGGSAPPGPSVEPGRSALLLAGGRSRRLGEEKPFVDIGGRSVLERVLAATASIDDVVLSVRDPAPFEAALGRQGWRRPGPAVGRSGPGDAGLVRGTRRIRLLADPEPDRGPLVALAGGLAAARGTLAIVLSVDLPFVTAELVDRLSAELAADSTADACVPVIGGRAQWLCAAYRTRLAPVAAEWVREAGGEGGVGAFVDRLALRRLDEAELAVTGDPAALTRDIDTPADLAWARTRAVEEDA